MATFLLVHGAWHDGSCWKQVIDALATRGHAAAAPDLPCDDPSATFADYAAVASAAVPDGVVPVVVGHSLAGCTIPLVADRRPCARLVFLASALPVFGRTDAPRQIDPALSAAYGHDDLGRGVWERDVAIEVMYAGLRRAVAEACADALRPQSWTPNHAPYPLEHVPDIPCTYVVCEDDNTVTREYSWFAARELLGVEPVVAPWGHFPMLEDPSGLADLLVGLLDETGEA